jgi:ferredoxin
MADNTDKVAGNVDGQFYVDSNCIDCDLCRQTAPDNFTRNEDDGFSFVSKQPESDEEQQACLDAMEECPVEAIGDDG